MPALVPGTPGEEPAAGGWTPVPQRRAGDCPPTASAGAGLELRLLGGFSAALRREGELLLGDRYQDWTSGPRERLRSRYLALLDRLAAGAAVAGRVEDALSWWEQAVEVDPYDEERYVAMASLLVRGGRLGPAQRVVRRAVTVLEHLGVPASPPLLELVRGKRSG